MKITITYHDGTVITRNVEDKGRFIAGEDAIHGLIKSVEVDKSSGVTYYIDIMTDDLFMFSPDSGIYYHMFGGDAHPLNSWGELDQETFTSVVASRTDIVRVYSDSAGYDSHIFAIKDAKGKWSTYSAVRDRLRTSHNSSLYEAIKSVDIHDPIFRYFA